MGSRGWQPPPRPPELKGVHAVNLNEERTEGIDYFALINDRRRENDARAAVTQKSKQKPSSQPGAGKATSPAEEPQATASVPPPNLGAGSTEALENPDGSVGARIIALAEQHRMPLTYAAAALVVAIGGYTVYSSVFSGNGGREPATKPEAAAAPATASSTASQTARAVDNKPTHISGPGSIGTGHGRTASPGHTTGGVTFNSPPPTPSSAPEPPRGDEAREAPQFYSSSDETPQALVPPAPEAINAPNPSAGGAPPPDPSGGYVQPPTPPDSPPPFPGGTSTY